MTGKLTISIDLELAWGVWDVLTPKDLRLAEDAERPICAAFIDLFDRHGIAVTWAMVAALLDEKSAETQPGPEDQIGTLLAHLTHRCCDQPGQVSFGTRTTHGLHDVANRPAVLILGQVPSGEGCQTAIWLVQCQSFVTGCWMVGETPIEHIVRAIDGALDIRRKGFPKRNDLWTEAFDAAQSRIECRTSHGQR